MGVVLSHGLPAPTLAWAPNRLLVPSHRGHQVASRLKVPANFARPPVTHHGNSIALPIFLDSRLD